MQIRTLDFFFFTQINTDTQGFHMQTLTQTDHALGPSALLGCAQTPHSSHMLPSAAGVRTLWYRCGGPRNTQMAGSENLFYQKERQQKSAETCSSRSVGYVGTFVQFHSYCYGSVYWLWMFLWNHTGNSNYFKEQYKSCFSVLSAKSQAFLCLDSKGKLYTSVSNANGNY